MDASKYNDSIGYYDLAEAGQYTYILNLFRRWLVAECVASRPDDIYGTWDIPGIKCAGALREAANAMFDKDPICRNDFGWKEDGKDG